MENLTVTLIQSNLHWESPGANRAMFEEKIWKIGKPTDIIVLPEMFTTGFSMNAGPLAEVMNQSSHKWMKQMAHQTGALILGSIIAKENGHYFNRLLWVEPGGESKTYDKRHLFRMADEHQVYSSGKHRLTAQWKGWNICPLVCYDLRFPVWSRNVWSPLKKAMDYDALIYVASWPQVRVSSWDALLRARAIENLAYVVGVNRVGVDKLGVGYNGHSAVIDPRGASVFTAEESETIATVTLNSQSLEEYRLKFPAHLDADDFRLS